MKPGDVVIAAMPGDSALQLFAFEDSTLTLNIPVSINRRALCIVVCTCLDTNNDECICILTPEGTLGWHYAIVFSRIRVSS